ncbi:IclR family transcriptional regulator C-terminal domain-containing protein [Streptomyces sp. NPDC005811]|uniref:IclR family transcriptional regulator n=1 Tax=Streptomyces sp. NPDC005811 TaxID=3154565 RepID=UPI0033FB8279
MGEKVMVIHHAFRPEGVVQPIETGATLPWSVSALGKAIVAFSPEEQRERLLSAPLVAPTGRTVIEPSALTEQLEQATTVGYTLESQEATLGDAGIAAPVFDRTGAVAGAIGLIGPVERFLDEERRQAYAIATRETARNLSRELGALPRSELGFLPYPHRRLTTIPPSPITTSPSARGPRHLRRESMIDGPDPTLPSPRGGQSSNPPVAAEVPRRLRHPLDTPSKANLIFEQVFSSEE